MLMKRISREDPERVFIVVKNGYATTVTNGQAVQWDMAAADGVTIDVPGAAFNRMAAFAGIITETIVNGDYGLMQVYGYHSAVIVDGSATENIYTGGPLFMSVAATYLEGPWVASGTTEELYVEVRPVACALEGYDSAGTTGTIKAVIFAM
jgi:hypothetical protein